MVLNSILKAVTFNTIHATKQQGQRLVLNSIMKARAQIFAKSRCPIFESDGGDACRLAQLGRAARGVY